MTRIDIFKQLWEEQDLAFDLMTEYDSLPHHYGTTVLYQAEAYVINEVGNNPMITLTDLAKALRKSPSACSQIVKKLVAKGLLTQIANQDNRRIYYLRLTAFGTTVFEDHEKFNDLCQQTTFDNLSEFTDEELMIHVKVQQALNRTYESDVQKSLDKYG